MAVRRRKNSGKNKSKSHGKSTASGGKVRIKGHWRSPRGKNQGKPRVRVPSHRRGKPRK